MSAKRVLIRLSEGVTIKVAPSQGLDAVRQALGEAISSGAFVDIRTDEGADFMINANHVVYVKMEDE